METELKLLVNPGDLARIGSARALAGTSSETGLLVNRYFDTADHQLSAQGMALRLRLQNGQWVQTLKSAGETAGGLHQRSEWEMPVATDALEWDRLPAEALPGSLQTDQVRVQFETRFERTIWMVESGDAVIEVALDSGQVSVGEVEEPICELELELKEGGSEALFVLAEAIASEIDVLPSDINKAERGYCLVAGDRNVPETPAPDAGLPALLGAVSRQAEQLPESSPVLAATLGLLVDREILHVGLGQALVQGLAQPDVQHWSDLPDVRRLGQWLLHAAHQWHVLSVTEC